ncbi:MAG: M20/M25/M40 family metallo-hydrolase [Planctomycetaceae bacterium]|nr:M20/M25/M40 family metallo-hydrolase [Planctomycetaceae bacterium]
MSQKLRDRIARYTNLDAPVGFEEPVLKAAREELAACCDRVEVDLRGNLYAFQTGTDEHAPLIMITAHADEIGFMVTSVLENGFLRFTKLGYPTDTVLPGQRVRVLADGDAAEGVIGVKPAHILSAEEARQVPALSNLYIDIGATSAEEVASWGIEAGTPITFVGELIRTRNEHRCFGKCVDNRAGIVALLEIAEQLQENPCAASVAYVVAVEEEIGLRGAEVAAMHVKPDVLFVLDTVPSGGTPDLRPDELPWDIGKGALLKVREVKGLSTQRPLRDLVRQVAEEAGVPYQWIVDTAGITDATSAQQASGDIAAMVIGIARRYAHSAVEMFDLRDVQAQIDLTVAATARITSVDQLRRL